ncbi:MAG: MATE family efflux transporter [Motilibacteraceae bacterium]
MRLRDRRDGELARLAVPALGALLAEPLFLLADSAIVGHLGTPQLAGLGVAGAVLSSVVALCVFLAYGTTSVVARRLGAGDLPGALRQGIDGLWLAVGLGVVLGLVALAAAPWVVDALGAPATAAPYAVAYLRVSAAGVPAMLLVLAATGVLRGLQDTRTPLVVAGVGAAVNVGLNLLLVLGLGLGIAGSALGTVLVQLGSAAAYVAVVAPAARAAGAPLRPDLPGIRAAARTGAPLLLRTATLRAALLLLTAVAAHAGGTALAAHQVAFTVWTFSAMALDALAIAGQAVVGRALGSGDVDGALALTGRVVGWSVAVGVVVGAVLLVARPVYVPWFSEDPAVRAALSAALVVAALLQPVDGVVFALDGVLIGAGDGRYLAVAGLLSLVAFVPLAVAVDLADGGLVAVWLAFAGFMLARLVTLVRRALTSAWAVPGAVRG